MSQASTMQGTMMKKKSSTPSILRSISLEWVTRHFVLFGDGKPMYSSNDTAMELVNNIGNCTIEPPNSLDLGANKTDIANSFVITNAKASVSAKRILLVAKVPEEFPQPQSNGDHAYILQTKTLQ
jgi:hypothetical protein